MLSRVPMTRPWDHHLQVSMRALTGRRMALSFFCTFGFGASSVTIGARHHSHLRALRRPAGYRRSTTAPSDKSQR